MVQKHIEQESQRTTEVLLRLAEHYPGATCALKHRSAFELLVATILSAQCTDERVNKVTPDLFEKYPDCWTMAQADPGDLEEIIRSTGFFRNKAKSLSGASKKLVEVFEGVVPDRMEDLLLLPGVARKTANVVLGTWYGIAAGVVVDTHVGRISMRLEFTAEKEPAKVEQDLMVRIPQTEWIDFSHRLIHFGRDRCKARRPLCEVCFLQDLCPFFLENAGR